jgi:hypothetical protein
LAARRRHTADMTPSFNYPTPILYRWFVEIFRPSLTVQNIRRCIDLTGNLTFGLQTYRCFGVLTPNGISYKHQCSNCPKITGGLGVETLANVPPGEQKRDHHSDDVTYDSSYYTIY